MNPKITMKATISGVTYNPTFLVTTNIATVTKNNKGIKKKRVYPLNFQGQGQVFFFRVQPQSGEKLMKMM
jgi:hypothetical protein